MADYPDWVQLVQILAGVVQATIDTSGGPVETTINTAGGPVQMTVTNNSLSVKTAAGDTVTVAGTIDATITGSNITIDTNTVNALLPMNELISIGSVVETVTNEAAGAVFGQFQTNSKTLGLYDGLYFEIFSQGQYAYDIQPANGQGGDIGLSQTPAYSGWEYTDSAITIPATHHNGSVGNGTVLAMFNKPTAMTNPVFRLVNQSGGTIASDTVTINVFGIRAQVQVTNPTTAPVPTQPVNGSPTASGNVTCTGQATTSIIPSGGIIKKLFMSVEAAQNLPADTVFWINNGSTSIACINMNGYTTNKVHDFVELDFGEGIANSGISGYFASASQISGTSGYATGYAIKQ